RPSPRRRSPQARSARSVQAMSDAAPAPIRVLALIGSLRKQSLNRGLFHAARELAPAHMTLTSFDALGEIPPYDMDADTQPGPAPVEALRAAVREADALLFVTPEYNYSVPGVLKNAIDWASRPPATTPLRGKPAGMMGVSQGMSGTIRAQLHL